MSWEENLAIAALVSVAMIGSYTWGYRDGVRYCARKMKPLADQAKALAEMIKKHD